MPPHVLQEAEDSLSHFNTVIFKNLGLWGVGDLDRRGTEQKALVLRSRDPSSVSDYPVISHVILGE